MIEKPAIDKNNILCFMLHSLSHIHDIAEDVMDMLPEKIKEKTKNVSIHVENFANQDTLNDLNIDSRYDLLGLYSGIPFHHSHINQNASHNVIYLFRGPIIRYTQEFDEPIETVIRQIIVQEVAHHFGIKATDLYLMLEKK